MEASTSGSVSPAPDRRLAPFTPHTARTLITSFWNSLDFNSSGVDLSYCYNHVAWRVQLETECVDRRLQFSLDLNCIDERVRWPAVGSLGDWEEERLRDSYTNFKRIFIHKFHCVFSHLWCSIGTCPQLLSLVLLIPICLIFAGADIWHLINLCI